jgi:hypothetical protein
MRYCYLRKYPKDLISFTGGITAVREQYCSRIRPRNNYMNWNLRGRTALLDPREASYFPAVRFSFRSKSAPFVRMESMGFIVILQFTVAKATGTV